MIAIDAVFTRYCKSTRITFNMMCMMNKTIEDVQ